MSTKPVNLNKVLFIKAVRRFPFIYDRYHVDHTNKPKVESTWLELATEFGFESVYAVKATWSNILKARKRAKTCMINGAGQEKPYVYEPHLTFLDEFIGHESNISNFENSNLLGLVLNNTGEYPNEDGSTSSTFDTPTQMQEYQFNAPEAKRYKVSNEKEYHGPRNTIPNRNYQCNENMGEAFGKTVAIALNRLSPRTQMQAQLDIMQVLLKYTEE